MHSLNSNHPHNCCSGSTQQGIALIEILIAVLVLAIGLLGIAALQSSSVRYSQSAQERTTALIMAGTLTEMIRSNPVVARAGSYAGNCESELLADWALQLQLATGTSSCPEVEWDPAAGVYTISISWLDEKVTGSSNFEILVRP
ncbi:type IV pilus modification protein PilV [Rheinheimera soli]|jgi:type IV pilus assembly protein PilV|uniref:Type IV pilus assembly protein PilV n=1 Tax=Rheinheimera soli TaxID=443616 RepID=A0ABU1VXC2_9GAMM|nr:type IV pilus modification protein PilV [Rheinheimera soli]MDR7120358.1 type IV pilus assembly protein PilV [Rheinheimera soli]